MSKNFLPESSTTYISFVLDPSYSEDTVYVSKGGNRWDVIDNLKERTTEEQQKSLKLYSYDSQAASWFTEHHIGSLKGLNEWFLKVGAKEEKVND